MYTYQERVKSSTPASVTVGATSTTVLADNPQRRYAILTNDSDEVMYIAFNSTAIMHKGIRLNGDGGALEINYQNYYTGVISAICASGGKNLCVNEG